MTMAFVIIYLLWFFSELSLALLKRSPKSDKKDSDKGSLGIIWAIVVVANIVSYYISVWIPLPILEDPRIRYVGLAVIILGVIYRFSVVASLGKLFTVNVTIREDHKLKTDGFYKYLRHPSYSAAILSFIGYGISLNNWISLILITGSAATAFLMRIGIEEKILTQHFGKEYEEYKKRTKRLIPFIY